MERENFINEIINSTNGITKVTPDVALYSKIQSKINSQKLVSTKWVWVAAASFTLLITLNISLTLPKKNNVTSENESIITSVSISNQLY